MDTGVAQRGRGTAIVAMAGALAIILLLRPEVLALELTGLCRVATAIVAACYVVVARHSPQRHWSAGAVFLLLLLLFHFGIVALTALHLPLAPADVMYTRSWFGGPFVPEAIYLSTLAALAYTLAYLLPSRRHLPDAARGRTPEQDKAAARWGLTMIVVGVAGYFGYVVTQAPELLRGGTYDTYLRTVGGSGMLALANLVITFGLVLAAAAPKCGARRAGLIVFAGYAVMILPLGVRTAVLFPIAAAVVAAASRHRLPSGRATIVVVLLGLTVVGLVREVRAVGLGGSVSVASANPLSALSELGGTLRPVAETISWQKGALSEDQYGGITYSASSLRIVERVLGQPVPPAAEDHRLAISVMADRSGVFQLGYTPVAEAYLNFGQSGVVVIFLLLGLLFGWVDRAPRRTFVSAATAGVVVAAFGLMVRNGSNSVPTTLAAGFAVLFVVHVLTRSMVKPARSGGLAESKVNQRRADVGRRHHAGRGKGLL